MFWNFYLPPIDEYGESLLQSVRGKWLPLYLVDPIAIVEVRGEEVLAPTLDGSRLWRRGPG
jgi:hypothetical protein